jgi:glycerol-3-phosphate acyltransferase PlsX
MLKTTEAVASFLFRFLKNELSRGVRNKIALLLLLPGFVGMLPGLLLLSPSIGRIARRLDYAEYGGALLLGLNGVVIGGHGRSNARAVKNAIGQARTAVQGGVVEAIRTGLTQPSDEL